MNTFESSFGENPQALSMCSHYYMEAITSALHDDRQSVVYCCAYDRNYTLTSEVLARARLNSRIGMQMWFGKDGMVSCLPKSHHNAFS
eukprot:5899844-Amphidinium_carterae.1